MKHIIKEETVIFISVLKWFFLSTAVGLIGGISASFFLKTLDLSINFLSTYKNYFYFIPLLFPLVVFINKNLFSRIQELSTDDVIKSFHKTEKISILAAPKIFITSIITISAGGSAGREAPCADICASIASFFSRFFSFKEKDYKKMVICGVSAGFASAFGVPLTGALFGVEVLFVGQLLYEALFPSVIAGVISYYISSLMGVHYFRNPILLSDIPAGNLLIKSLFAGIVFGIISIFVIEIMRKGRKINKKLRLNIYLKSVIAGILIVLFALIFSTDYLGLSINQTISFLENKPSNYYDFFLKTIFTMLTLCFGGSGGIITPLFFIGASSGNSLAQLMGENNLAFYSALGLVSVISGTLNTPLAASIMAIELFGPSIATYAIIASVVSFLITGHRSLYPSQILSFQKSMSVNVIIDAETEERRVEINIRKGTLLYLLLSFKKKMKTLFLKKTD